MKRTATIFILLIGLIGCKSNSSTEDSKINRTLITNYFSNYLNLTKVERDNYFQEKLGFKLNSQSECSSPMIIDRIGNVFNGGTLKFKNNDSKKMEIISSDINTLTIKIDEDMDSVFSEEEITTKKITPHLKIDNHITVYDDEIQIVLDAKEGDDKYIDDDEKMEVSLSIMNPNSVYPQSLQSFGSGSSANNGSYSATYMIDGENVSQEIYEEEDKRLHFCKNKAKELFIQQFLEQNSLIKDDLVQTHSESSFKTSLTKQEIKDLSEKNRGFGLYIGIPATPSDE